jgi:threonine aldolase
VVTDFRSDNTHGTSPEILDAVMRAAAGNDTSYGGDALTARVRERCRDLFETEVDVFPVLTGTAGNALSIATLTPPWGVVFCHEDAHIQREEMGASEFYTHGAKLVPVAGAGGKLHAADVDRTIGAFVQEGRAGKASCVSMTQATEAGTVYSADELRALGEAARRYKCRMHLDGARFANAVASTGAAPADLTWRAGIDLLVFGGTKNGLLSSELIVVFDRSLAEELAIRWQRGGHRLSKMRFLSAQFDAYLADDLWLRNARHANAMARRLGEGLELIRPVETNMVFTRFEPHVARALEAQGYLFYDWTLFGEGVVRLVTGFRTTEADVDALVKAIDEARRSAR